MGSQWVKHHWATFTLLPYLSVQLVIISRLFTIQVCFCFPFWKLSICFQIYLGGLLSALRKQRLREAKWSDQTHRTRGDLEQDLTSASCFKPFLFSQHFIRPWSIHFNPFCLTVLNLLIWDDYLRHLCRKWLVCLRFWQILSRMVTRRCPESLQDLKAFLFPVKLSQQSFELCTINTILLHMSSYTLV